MIRFETQGVEVPAVTPKQMKEVDRRMVEEYGVLLIQMMENAGRALAEVCRLALGGDLRGRRVVVAAGKGNNGGGGLAAARHLHNWGAEVSLLIQQERLSRGPLQQLQALRALALPIKVGDDALGTKVQNSTDLVVSALVGYSLRGPPKGWVKDIIEGINSWDLPVVALDLPTGVDPTTGEVYDPSLRATWTVTLALPKAGLAAPRGRMAAGSIYLADIGVPRELYHGMGIDVGPIFTRSSLLSLRVVE
jgi:NAD(P)H-hydrate epimerase